MKTRLLIIIGIITILSVGSFLILLQIQFADVAPCFDKEKNRHVPCSPETSIQFYEYKGEDWMKMKKQEMIEVMLNNTFHAWVDQTKDDHSHWNVYQYYSYTEDLSKQILVLKGIDNPTTKPITESTPKWKIPEELEKMGCTDAMVIHLKKYSNAFDEKWNGKSVAIEDIGLPWGVHQYALDECMQNISELRNNEN